VQLKNNGLAASDIDHIECVVPEIEVPMVCEPAELKRRPTSPYGAKFSLPFMVAASLIDGKVDGQTFTAKNIERQDLLALAARVKYRVAAAGETTFPEYFPGWVRAHLNTGKVVEERMDMNWGTPGNPMPQEALERKFRDNLADLGYAAEAKGLVASIAGLETRNIADIDSLLAFPSQH
jgi:2-methylcitrate dehydratase PrpD